eukprot:scpid102501/ scgid32464/ 
MVNSKHIINLVQDIIQFGWPLAKHGLAVFQMLTKMPQKPTLRHSLSNHSALDTHNGIEEEPLTCLRASLLTALGAHIKHINKYSSCVMQTIIPTIPYSSVRS